MPNYFRVIQVKSIKNQALIADKCFVADSFFQRLKGLMGRRDLKQGEGLLISPCRDIHMWFMRIPIDVVFIKKLQNPPKELSGSLYQVTGVRESLRPWRLFPVWCRKATDTLELPVGTIQRCGIQAGDPLCLS